MKRALVIDPVKRTVTEVSKEWTLAELQEAVGGYIEDASRVSRTAVFVNEEGRLRHLPGVWDFSGLTIDTVVGPAVILGIGDKGETVSTTLPVDVARDLITWYE